MFELDRYYKECKKNNLPFIKARKNPIDNNYLVQLDLLTCDFKLSKKGVAKIENLFQKEIQFLKLDNLTSSVFKGRNIDDKFVWFDGVLANRLNNFCESLFDLSLEYNQHS